MVESYPLKIKMFLNLLTLMHVNREKIFHCPSNQQVQSGNYTIVNVFTLDVRINE